MAIPGLHAKAPPRGGVVPRDGNIAKRDFLWGQRIVPPAGLSCCETPGTAVVCVAGMRVRKVLGPT